jgi:hypothetical protein
MKSDWGMARLGTAMLPMNPIGLGRAERRRLVAESAAMLKPGTSRPRSEQESDRVIIRCTRFMGSIAGLGSTMLARRNWFEVLSWNQMKACSCP